MDTSPIVIAAPSPLVPRPHDGARPLSYQQTGWREVERLEMVGYRGPAGEYCSNNHLALHIAGPVDVTTLRQALTAVVARHDTLRTTFHEDGAAPVQMVRPARPLIVEVADVSRNADPAATAERLAAQVVLGGFNYGEDQLVRAALFTRSTDDHLLVIVMPHLVSDASSLHVLAAELAASYRGAPEAARASSAAVQYGDFVMWQRDWLGHRARADVLAYYRNRIAGAPTAAFHDRQPSDARRTWASANRVFALPAHITAAVRSVSWRTRVTPFVLLFAVYQIALWMWTGHDDLIVTVPFAGRRDARTADMIGFFACLALVRARLSGNPTFRELLGRTHAVVKEAYANEGLPYGALKEIAAELADAPPPMTVCINLAPEEKHGATTMAPFAPAHVSIEAAGGYRLTRYDVNLLVQYSADGNIGGQLRYATDSLDASAAEALVRHLVLLLEAATANPDRLISELARMTLDKQDVPIQPARAVASPVAAGVADGKATSRWLS
jgi:hypothetical protein